MARTESIPQAEYLAGLALARMRRLAGHPHLAGRILHSLRAHVPDHWVPWLEWEQALAGETDVRTTAATAIIGARAAAMASDRDGTSGAIAVARDALAGFRAIQEDADVLDLLLAPERQSLSPADERPFVAFAGDAYVLCRVAGPGARVRAVALPFVEAERVESGGTRGRRVATLAAVLGLAGEELSEGACFQRVYGFTFVPEIHRGSFDVLLHRARAALEGLAAFERRDTRVRMVVTRPFVIADPRMVEPAEARILRAVAAGQSTARSIAESTGLSLRQTQLLLKSLAEEGECAADKRGRVLHYQVEDTTFSEPTQILDANRSKPGEVAR